MNPCRTIAPCVLHFTALPSILQAQTTDTLWSEKWKGHWIADWHVDGGTWEVAVSTSALNAPESGSNCAATVLGGNYPSNASARLIRHSSANVLSAGTDPRLGFRHGCSTQGGADNSGNVSAGTHFCFGYLLIRQP